mmetsp:Transcript_64297/g.119493  ORF Transcript_64297/g.119493 Transcript_64297/m.119493 type:complete len:821 (-) Transcript_64297:133-2595(-)
MPASTQVRPRAKSIGHYVLGKTIGEGTFGKVKLGTHILTGERVAVKVLEKERIQEVADVERVAREVHILKLIHHPHIVQLYEIIETRRQLYLIMEYASGGELFEYIVSSGRVQEAEACRFFHQIIAGVEKIHMMQIVHRDLKPENLLLDDHRNIKIVDFGLSNVYRDGQLLKTACGSPCYAAPEMIAGHSYVPSLCDLWSCGVILFALVCGYLPFEDQNTATLYKKILAADYRSPRFISEGVKDLISGLLTTDPTRRFTVPVVRSHPWYRQIPEASVPPRDLSLDRQGLEEDVLRELESFGFPRDYAVRCLEVNKHNHVTTTYYLLVEKKRRMLDRLDRFMPGSDLHRNFALDYVTRPGHEAHDSLRLEDMVGLQQDIAGLQARGPTGVQEPVPSHDSHSPSSSMDAQGCIRDQKEVYEPTTTPTVAAPIPSPRGGVVEPYAPQTYEGHPGTARSSPYTQVPAWATREGSPAIEGRYPINGSSMQSASPSQPHPGAAHAHATHPIATTSAAGHVGSATGPAAGQATSTETPRRRSPMSSGSYLGTMSPGSVMDRLYEANNNSHPAPGSSTVPSAAATAGIGHTVQQPTVANGYPRAHAPATSLQPRTVAPSKECAPASPGTSPGQAPTRRPIGTTGSGSITARATYSSNAARATTASPRDITKPTESTRRRADLTLGPQASERFGATPAGSSVVGSARAPISGPTPEAPQSARARLGGRPPVPSVATAAAAAARTQPATSYSARGERPTTSRIATPASGPTAGLPTRTASGAPSSTPASISSPATAITGASVAATAATTSRIAWNPYGAGARTARISPRA